MDEPDIQQEPEPEPEIIWNLATLVQKLHVRANVEDTTRKNDVSTITRLYRLLNLQPEHVFDVTDFDRTCQIIDNARNPKNGVLYKKSHILKYYVTITFIKLPRTSPQMILKIPEIHITDHLHPTITF